MVTYMRVNRCHCGHVFLGRQEQLVVDDVLGHVADTVKGTCGMKCHGHAGAEVDELADSLYSCGLMEEARTDALADGVPVCAAADEGHFLFGHDVEKLVSDFLSATEGFGVQEMLGAPGIRVTVGFPLSVNMEKGQVVGFWNEEFLAG